MNLATAGRLAAVGVGLRIGWSMLLTLTGYFGTRTAHVPIIDWLVAVSVWVAGLAMVTFLLNVGQDPPAPQFAILAAITLAMQAVITIYWQVFSGAMPGGRTGLTFIFAVQILPTLAWIYLLFAFYQQPPPKISEQVRAAAVIVGAATILNAMVSSYNYLQSARFIANSAARGQGWTIIGALIVGAIGWLANLVFCAAILGTSSDRVEARSL